MEKTLDLKMPGAIELGREDLKKVDGGLLQVVLAVIAIGGAAIYAYNNAGDFVEGFKEGWEDGRK